MALAFPSSSQAEKHVQEREAFLAASAAAAATRDAPAPPPAAEDPAPAQRQWSAAGETAAVLLPGGTSANTAAAAMRDLPFSPAPHARGVSLERILSSQFLSSVGADAWTAAVAPVVEVLMQA